MKVGDLVYYKHPRMANMTDKPGIIVKKQKMYKFGHRYHIMFPGVGLQWVEFMDNLIPFEDCWSEDETG